MKELQGYNELCLFKYHHQMRLKKKNQTIFQVPGPT